MRDNKPQAEPASRRVALRLAICTAVVAFGMTVGGAQAQTVRRVPGAEPTAPAADAADAAPVQRRAAIKLLTDSDYPPFNYFDEDGTLAGFNIDLARSICLELAAACDIQVRPWADLMAALKRGDADAVMASHSVTALNLRDVDFSDRYYHTPGRFVGRRGAPALDVTPEGLEGKTVAVAKGTAHEAYLRAFFRDTRIQTYENVELARDAIITGAADLLFDDGVGLVFWLNGTASKACCEFRGGAFVEPRYFGDGIGIAVRKSDPELKGLLNSALRRIRSSGRMEELLLRYFPLKAY